LIRLLGVLECLREVALREDVELRLGGDHASEDRVQDQTSGVGTYMEREWDSQQSEVSIRRGSTSTRASTHVALRH
jgi:hypothetical protein